MPNKKNNFIQSFLESDDFEKYIELFPHNISSSGYDPWGLNINGIKSTLGIAKYLYTKYFRVEAFGLENIPKDGRVLIIPNHSGQLPIDGMMTGYSMITNPYAPRVPKAMVERFFPTLPFVGNWLSSIGSIIGDPYNCAKLLDNDEAIIVFPEGVRGSGKLFKDRYKLQRFGNGFMHLAMKHNTPIIPVGIVGFEESIVSFANMKGLADLLKIPYAPLIIPALFPTKVYIHFGKPLYFENDIESEYEVKARVNIIKNEIKNLIDIGLSKRTSLF
jgi:1-acyl-sn-glycerol-3-phosphate acyltransferase